MTAQSIPNACPSCGKGLASDAVVCIQCGFDKRKGRRLQLVKSVRRALSLPRISGVQSFFVLLACMGITALVVPMTLKLPVWIEAEVVIAAWWVIWGMALTLCLYNGWQVTHDFEKPAIASLTFATPADSRDSYGRGWWNGFLWGSSPDLGGADNSVAGCLVLIVLIILLPFIVVFLAEAAVFLAFVLYFMIRGMLAQVANSRLRCRGRLARSFAFGFFWATLYTVPLAGLVWVVHRVHS